MFNVKNGVNYTNQNENHKNFRKKRNIKIDIIVVRLNKTDSTCNSYPCCNCMNYLSNIDGIRVNRVYYYENGQLQVDSFSRMTKSHLSWGGKYILKSK